MAHSATRALLLGISGLLLSACATEELPLPEPLMETPGAFVAVDEGEDTLLLFRTLSALTVQNGDKLLFITIYDADPASYEEAREIAKSHELPMRAPMTFASKNLVIKNPYEVVWFRTLTEEEEARIP